MISSSSMWKMYLPSLLSPAVLTAPGPDGVCLLKSSETRELQEVTLAGLEVIVGLGCKETGHDIFEQYVKDVPSKSPIADSIDSSRSRWRL